MGYPGESEIEVGKISSTVISELGKIYRMPEEVAMGRDEEKKAWACGLFMGISNEDAFETRILQSVTWEKFMKDSKSTI